MFDERHLQTICTCGAPLGDHRMSDSACPAPRVPWGHNGGSMHGGFIDGSEFASAVAVASIKEGGK